MLRYATALVACRRLSSWSELGDSLANLRYIQALFRQESLTPHDPPTWPSSPIWAAAATQLSAPHCQRSRASPQDAAPYCSQFTDCVFCLVVFFGRRAERGTGHLQCHWTCRRILCSVFPEGTRGKNKTSVLGNAIPVLGVELKRG